MKRILAIVSTVFVSIFCVFGQEDITPATANWGVFVSPLSVFNPSYPAFHVGAEKPLGKWSALAEIGVLLPKSVYQNENSPLGFQDFSGKNKGFFLKLEGKRYFSEHWYFAGNAQLLMNNTERTDLFDATPEITDSWSGFWFCSTCVEETYSIKKTMIGLTLKVGVKYDLPKNFYLDGYVGLGANYHMNEHSANSDLHKNPAQADGLIGYYDAFYPGNYFYHVPVPTIGLRVGYSID